MKVKEESEKVGLKQHSENEDHFTANKWGNSNRLYFGGSKITAAGDCSHEIKKHLLFVRMSSEQHDDMMSHMRSI